MFDAIKQQVKEYLPDTLSPFATALTVGGVTFVIASILLFFEIIRPGITTALPELVVNMLILSSATIMTGLVAWMLQKHKKTISSNTRLLPRHTGSRAGKRTQGDKYFNYHIKDVEISYKLISEKNALFTDTRTFMPVSDVIKPIKLVFQPLMRGVNIRLVTMNGYIPSKGRLADLKRWNDQIALQTNFRGPVSKGSERVASVTIEVAGDQAPYHVYCGSRYPIKGAIRFAIDMSFDSTKHHTAKLYEFISSRATRPIVESKDAQTKMFQEGKLHWVVERPSANHIYVVTWKEPCECSWCQAVNFG